LAVFLIPIITVVVLVALVGDRPSPGTTTVQSAAK
jgi:hypothetical protein